MPRGVYDREKTKEERAAEKTGTVTAAPKKVGRPVGSGKAKVTAKATAAPVKAKTPKAVKAKKVTTVTATAPTGDMQVLFNEVRSNLVTLDLIAERFGSDLVRAEITAHVAIIGNLRKQVFGDATAATESTETIVEEETVANGTSATQYQGTVPMPPSPVQIPSLPSTH